MLVAKWWDFTKDSGRNCDFVLIKENMKILLLITFFLGTFCICERLEIKF